MDGTGRTVNHARVDARFYRRGVDPSAFIRFGIIRELGGADPLFEDFCTSFLRSVAPRLLGAEISFL